VRSFSSATSRFFDPLATGALSVNRKAYQIVLSTILTGGLCAIAFASCSSNNTPSGPAGGPVVGSADDHCVGVDPQTTSQTDCQFRPPPDAAGTTGPDAGPEYGATMYGTEGDDDDCKYHVTWTASPIYENYDVYFTVVATALVDNSVVTGANIYAEAFLNDTHPAPPTNQTANENPPGTYKVGPIQFDEGGEWTVRFHLFENCLDYADDSPHGHAAFYVDVP
jgi:hypothetical protein